jgi:hypothetical protein
VEKEVMSRYKPVGWRYESHKHALAAKGVKTKYTYSSKKQIPSKDEFAEQIHAEHPNLPFSEVERLAAHRRLSAFSEKEHGRGDYFIRKSKKAINDTEYDKWVVAHNIEVKSIKPSARTKYAKPDKINWIALKKRLAKHKKKGDSPYDAYIEEIQTQFKPIQSNTRMTPAQRKVVRKELGAARKEAAIRAQLDSIVLVVSAVPGGGMRRKESSEAGSKKKKKAELDENDDEILKKKPKAGKLGEAIGLPGSYANYGDLILGKEERMPKVERVARIKKNPKGTPGIRAEDVDDEFDDMGVDSY